MTLTKLFTFAQPDDEAGTEEILSRQDAIVGGIAETIQGGEKDVLRALNEYAEIGRLGQYFHSKRQCLILFGALHGAGYKAGANTDAALKPDDSKNVARYLIGQAMHDLGAGNPPSGTFITQSSMALNSVPPSKWRDTVDAEMKAGL
ncbi:MAG: hypothetical protein KA099_04995 [Alphaproteobacteria bacterium]|nr:hypothetical protein [Alphaproteobacteria bacterium]MBP7759253.1 hypothetical protein [Alphaproteobacteria bacterium]MBP7761887.1 hypothetical protein [Alphaproteobacteria bacterium]MBP7904668.1 hypothetical protein [Alphaproteobacteria bacterium]